MNIRAIVVLTIEYYSAVVYRATVLRHRTVTQTIETAFP
jgi:hypothetical protein